MAVCNSVRYIIILYFIRDTRRGGGTTRHERQHQQQHQHQRFRVQIQRSTKRGVLRAGPRQWSTDDRVRPPSPFAGHYCRRHVSKLKRVPSSDFSDRRFFCSGVERAPNPIPFSRENVRPARHAADVHRSPPVRACVSVFFYLSYPSPRPIRHRRRPSVRIRARARILLYYYNDTIKPFSDWIHDRIAQ